MSTITFSSRPDPAEPLHTLIRCTIRGPLAGLAEDQPDRAINVLTDIERNDKTCRRYGRRTRTSAGGDLDNRQEYRVARGHARG
jgi:hypothetical protein